MVGFMGRVMEGLTAIAAVATLPIGLLTLFFLGWQAALAVFVVGWLLLVPVFGILLYVFGDETDESSEVGGQSADIAAAVHSAGVADDAPASDPLGALRDRYARGEINDDEFERRVDALLETDPAEPASLAAERVRDRETERS